MISHLPAVTVSFLPIAQWPEVDTFPHLTERTLGNWGADGVFGELP